ncbi:MAG: type II toxin-antitoxin system VapC family toxin [Acetobacteraceae bacterium]|nr:type II toxin-antitoxin system VapC family toxin [Acetobacteraceae bacterium]
MILLDTNVISELVRPSPDPSVVAFLRRQPPETVFTSAVCEAEIRYGLARLPPSRRRDDLTNRIAIFLASGFPSQTLPFDSACAALYGEIRASREAMGKPIAVEDGMIAATARSRGAIVATRNAADFEVCGVDIVNPWETI